MIRPTSTVTQVVFLTATVTVILCHFVSSQHGVNDEPKSNRRTLSNFIPPSLNCSNLSLVHFLSYFPCVNITSEEELKGCDIFAYVAAEMAAERINRDDEVFETTELKLAVISDVSTTSSVLGFESLMDIIQHLLDDEIRQSLWGVVGPLSSSHAGNLAPIVSIGNGGIMMVSYTARDPGLNNPTGYQSTFYRSLPSDDVISKGIVSLLRKFEWYRIGVINSQQQPYPQITENFRKVFDLVQDMITIGFEESYVGTFHVSSFLKQLRKRDVNIIVGFFGPSDARNVLCEAQKYDLTTSNHVWILPAYYNPEWWKLSPSEVTVTTDTHGCSDDEIVDILNKLVIFVDGVKFPTLDLSMSRFYSELIVKTRQLFPSLSDVDLSRYLQHSRATSAYDAVMLLARSLDVVADRGGDLCHDPLTIQTALERCLIDCELDRLHSYQTCNGLNNSATCLHNSQCNLRSVFEDLRRSHALNAYGQVMVSQFINGKECPVTLYRPDSNQTSGGEFIKLSHLANGSYGGGQWLGVVGSENSFLRNDSLECPSDFQWKGTGIPRSHSTQHSFIPVHQFAVVTFFMTIGFTFGIVTLIVNIVWRNKRQIKASSPRLNVVLLCGLFLVLPSHAVFNTFTLSALEYGISEHSGTFLCQMEIWTLHLGNVLIVMTLVAKNWRIYRIFYNKKLKTISDELSDNSLLFKILISTIPTFIILITWSCHSLYKFVKMEYQNDDQVINLTTCSSPHFIIWQNVLNGYSTLLLLILFLLSFCVAIVPTQHHSKQGWATHIMVLMVLLPAPFLLVLEVLLKEDPFLWLEYWWIGTLWTVFIVPLAFAILFSPQYIGLLAEHARSRNVREREKQQSEITKKYAKIKEESAMLKDHLKQLEVEIEGIKSSKQTLQTLPVVTGHMESQR